MYKAQVSDDSVPTEFVRLAAPHVESFDYFADEGMAEVVQALEPVEVVHPATKEVWQFWFDNPSLGKPVREGAIDTPLLPRECREAGLTYKGRFMLDLLYMKQGSAGPPQRLPRRMGALPVMVQSSRCHLRGLKRSQLVRLKEEPNEFGGYFVCNGIERLIRLLIMPRRHYVLALRRGAFQKRGADYTDAATVIRCVRSDETSTTARCHYLKDGSVNFAFTMNRAEYFIPAGILLKCLLEVTDKELFAKIVSGAPRGQSAFVSERAEVLLRQAARLGLMTRAACVSHVGSHFRVLFSSTAASSTRAATDFELGLRILREHVFPHLHHDVDKLHLLLHMLHKLYALVGSQCCEDNPDALVHHEVLLPGQLLLKFLHEKLEDWLAAFRALLQKELHDQPMAANLTDIAYVKKVSDKVFDLGKKFDYLLNTGTLLSRSGLDLQQASGFTVVAEKLNFFRYLSHFRSCHRGAYFAQMRTTTVRKLLPESWGFMCPVHTPDGSPCGLLNHLTHVCRVATAPWDGHLDTLARDAALTRLLSDLGVAPIGPSCPSPSPPDYLLVCLDGRVVGHVAGARAPALVHRLRQLKAARLLESDPAGSDDVLDEVRASRAVPGDLEVAWIPYQQGGVYPGVFLFTQMSRLVRPVRQLGSGHLELIGTLEQSHMSIRCPDGGAGGSPGLSFTHEEVEAGSILSVVASLTPYSDFNQSPRNMYQCQMGKQTMGFPAQAVGTRTDTKLYRLLTPQTPLARTRKYDMYKMDEYPSGMNTVVAVLAYTGFDMEDACILNKSSTERGFAHGVLYKTESINLRDDKVSARLVFEPLPALDRTAKQRDRSAPDAHSVFGDRLPQNRPALPGSHAIQQLGVVPDGEHLHSRTVDTDGLPHVGAVVWPGQAYAGTLDKAQNNRRSAKTLGGFETAVVDQVTLVGSQKGDGEGFQQANVRFRFNRNPVIGDKFSSRHGQKGVLSQLWPDVDMPFCCETGMRPDLIINPHAFPSRMTIGMLLESLTSKAGALTGQFVDATPFQRCEPGNGIGQNAAEHYGRLLEAAGYARHGQETMVSGITGEEMPCDIYIGPVYYQRLRHMVKDKFQVRSVGKINPLTRQPLKGRKVGGGIRFGEMERDSLLGHGAAFLLHDRLHTCSDYHVADVCSGCGLMLSSVYRPLPASEQQQQWQAVGLTGKAEGGKVRCSCCDADGCAYTIQRVAMPYVFRYLVTELAAMNIKVSVTTK